MTRFPPMYLNNDENNIVSSIIEEEASELKDATFSTQSNISMNDEFGSKSFQNSEYKSHSGLFPPKTQNQGMNNDLYSNHFTVQNFQSEKNQIGHQSNFDLTNISDVESGSYNERNQNENYKKYDIDTLKSEVDSLMSHVRGTSNIKRSSPHIPKIESTSNNQNQNVNKSPQLSPANKNSYISNQSENNFSRNNSSTQSPFMFQTAQNQEQNLNQKIQAQYENYDMNSSVTSVFSNKWQNYDNNKSGSFLNNNKSSSYLSPHVEFLDFQNSHFQPRSPFSKYSGKKNYDSNIENEDAPFVLPQAEFPDAPKVLQYRFSRKPDSSKQDLADLDRLRKENFNLKAEMLKLEKRLQLEEEEHKKLVNSLEKSERIRAEYRAKIEKQNK